MDKTSVLIELEPLRKGIDNLDKKIVDLLNQRADLVKKIGSIKQGVNFNDPIIRPDRESQIIQNLQKGNQGLFPNKAINAVWVEIISACRNLERKINVSYLGPKGTFSEQAVFKFFGHFVNQFPYSSFDDVFRSVELDQSDVGIVPIENSTEGTVNRSSDLLLNTSLNIIGESIIPVRHCLMAKHGSMDNIKSIHAHPQALSQCINWKNKYYPNLPIISSSSNAEAAKTASEDASVAAIAGEIAAHSWNLKIIESGIQDDVNNRTRFISIGKVKTLPTGRDKTSLILSVPNRAGAVYKMLFPLVKNNVSMTKFESRPARHSGKWEYYFYVDVKGHFMDENVSKTLNELENNVDFFKLLGSYPSFSEEI